VNFNSRLDLPAAAPRRQAESTRSKRESAAVCRQRAANDLLASASMINANQRLRMERSAATWAERAETLQRVEEALARRTAETAAKRAVIGDEPVAAPTRL
jgi:hypothetical protein